METITPSQIQELVMRLPAAKLPFAFSFLANLADKETELPSPQLDFLLLPLSERRRLMAEQAKRMVSHYEQTAGERQAWQAGDFADEY
jgi:hypothetical protein